MILHLIEKEIQSLTLTLYNGIKMMTKRWTSDYFTGITIQIHGLSVDGTTALLSGGEKITLLAIPLKFVTVLKLLNMLSAHT
jgi:hypothetical protein